MKRRQILDLSKSRFNPLTICLTVKEFWRGSLMIKEVNIFRSLLNRETNNMKTPWLGLDKCSKIRQRTALHSLGYGLHCKCFTPIANLREFFNEWQQLVSFQMVCQRHVEMSLTFTCEWLLCKVAVQAQACTSKMAEQLQWEIWTLWFARRHTSRSRTWPALRGCTSFFADESNLGTVWKQN